MDHDQITVAGFDMEFFEPLAEAGTADADTAVELKSSAVSLANQFTTALIKEGVTMLIERRAPVRTEISEGVQLIIPAQNYPLAAAPKGIVKCKIQTVAVTTQRGDIEDDEW